MTGWIKADSGDPIRDWRPTQPRGPHTVNNRKHNSHNPYQGDSKKVLTVCSAGLLRSPTAAVVLSQEPYNYNTRAAGSYTDFALVPVDDVLIYWADEIVFMTQENYDMVADHFGVENVAHKAVILHIDDNFAYRDPDLMSAIRHKYDEHLEGKDADVHIQV